MVLSAVVPWELAVRVGLGKLTLEEPLATIVTREVNSLRLVELPVTRRHGLATGNLPIYHRDPFDRLLVPQAVVEEMSIISADEARSRYPVTVLW